MINLLNNKHIVKLSLFFISLFTLFYVGTPIDPGGDEIFKFRVLKQYYEINNFDQFIQVKEFQSFLHHVLRSVLFFPIYLLNKIFGYQPFYYFLQSYFYGSFFSIALYLILKDYFNNFYSFCFSIIIFLYIFSLHFITFTQLTADICFLIFNLILISNFQKNVIERNFEKKKYIIICGLFITLIYISRETSAYVIATYFLYFFLFFKKKITNNISKLILFFTPLTIYLLIETWIVYKITNFKYGKLFYITSKFSSHNIVLSSNEVRDKLIQIGSIKENIYDWSISFFDYYKFFGFNIFSLICVGFIISIYFLIKKKVYEKEFFISYVYLSIFLFQTYFVISFNPITFPEAHAVIRYFLFLFTISLILIFIFINLNLSNYLNKKINLKKILVTFFLFLILFLAFIYFNKNRISKSFKKFNETSIYLSFKNFSIFERNKYTSNFAYELNTLYKKINIKYYQVIFITCKNITYYI